MPELDGAVPAARAAGLKLTAFGQVIVAAEFRGFPTWEQWAVAHLLKPCDEPVLCGLHMEWAAAQEEGL